MKDFGTMHGKGRQAASERHYAATAARVGEFLSSPLKRDLQAMLADAVRHTAALPVEDDGSAA